MRILQRLAALTFTCLMLANARADLAIIAHPDNPLASLSEKDVQKIFLGRLRMFPDSDLETQTLDLPDNSELYSRFYARIAQMTPAKVRRYRAFYLFSGKGKVPYQAQNQQDAINKVTTEKNAIGYVDATSDLTGVKVLLILQE